MIDNKISNIYPFNDLLETKLDIPIVNYPIIKRQRLTAILQAGLDKRVTQVIAPTGYGKTTLLVEWLSTYQTNNWQTIWLTLDAFDNSTLRFWSYIIAGIKKIFPQLNYSSRQFTTPGVDPEDLIHLNPLINEISSIPHPLCLVLDDFQTITNKNIHRSVSYLIAHQPANLHIIFSSRVQLPIPVSRLRAQRQLTEISVNDLSFTHEEAFTFLSNSMGFNLEPELVNRLLSATEGWIAGLQLAALSIHGTSDLLSLDKGIIDHNPEILRYLVEEVLSQQDEEIKDFLLKTSILSELSAPLCNALLDRTDSQVLLNQIETKNLFLIHLDPHQHWYRYQSLFGEAMGVLLQQTLPQELPELHRRACRWLVDHGYPDKAVYHALAAGDQDFAAQILNDWAMQAIMDLDLVSLVHWISYFSDELFKKYPKLGICYALANRLLGRLKEVEPVLQIVEKAINSLPKGYDTQSLLWKISVIRALMEPPQYDEVQRINLYLELLKNTPKNDTYFHGLIHHSLAEIYDRIGKYQPAVESYEQGCDFALQHNLFSEYVHSLCAIARIHKIQSRLNGAEEIYQKTLDFSIQHNLDASASAMAEMGIVEIELERGLLQDAYGWVEEITANFNQVRVSTLPRHFLILLILRLARYYYFCKDLTNAREYLQMAVKQNREFLHAIFNPEIIDLKVRLDLLAGKPVIEILNSAGKGISNAETQGPLGIAQKTALARIYLYQNQPIQAIPILREAETIARQTECLERLIEIQILLAVSYQSQKMNKEAIRSIRQALVLAEPGGYVLRFIEQGAQLKKLLDDLFQSKSSETEEEPISFSFLKRVIAAYETWQPLPCRQNNPHLPAIIHLSPIKDQLTDREIEILRIMAAGKSRKEIALSFQISLNTVKAHIKSIYKKLGRNTRKDALQRAIELEIIPSPDKG